MSNIKDILLLLDLVSLSADRMNGIVSPKMKSCYIKRVNSH